MWTVLTCIKFCIILYLAKMFKASGIFQVEIIKYNNRELLTDSQTIILYSLCLKEANSLIYGAPCTYGNMSSLPVVSTTPISLKLPFTFRWMKSFTMIVSISTSTSNGDYKLIEKHIHFDDNVLPTNRSSDSIDTWLYKTFKTSKSHLTYRYRIYCSLYYHGDECSAFCRPRNDNFGHYLCLNNGQKQCLGGWQGANCDKPKCRQGCNELHGYCSKPDQCQCRPGYSGPLCNQCLLYPGCLHGYCLKPWQCICYRNWGGILCDQDLNYCGTHQPCLNGGICDNIAPNQYKCLCKKGYNGNNCQIVNPCVTSPCLHGGTCHELNSSSFECDCPQGWTGSRCQSNINECSSNPCLNHGKCIDLINGYQCICSPGFTGAHCQQDINECSLDASLSPCIPSTTESCDNMLGSFKCNCVKGFEGVHCEQNTNDCEPNPCLNGATCIDLINSYQCVCQKGFKGIHCQEVDENVCNLSGNDSYWEMTSKIESCSVKWCKCSQNKRPFCVCIENDYSQTEIGATFDTKEPLNSLILVFEKGLTENQTQNICDALRAIFTLYQDSLEPLQLSTICKLHDYNSLVFYSTDNSENVLKTGDILLSSRTFRIKQIIKNRQDSNEISQNIQLLLTLILIILTISFMIGFSFIGSFLIIKKYLKKQRMRHKKNTNTIERVKNNLKNNDKPFNINVISMNSNQLKTNSYKSNPLSNPINSLSNVLTPNCIKNEMPANYPVNLSVNVPIKNVKEKENFQEQEF